MSYYNEGVGHGGFVATFATAGSVIVDDFSLDDQSSHVIQQPDQFGVPRKWVGVGPSAPIAASAQVQLPTTGSGDASVAVLIPKGDSFTAPATHGGGNWVVTGSGSAFRAGDFWKANLTLHRKLN